LDRCRAGARPDRQDQEAGGDKFYRAVTGDAVAPMSGFFDFTWPPF
jgi:hypothetical protein